MLCELAWPCGFGTVGPAVTRPYSPQALRRGLVTARPETPKEFSLCELFMGKGLPLAFHYHAQLNRRVEPKSSAQNCKICYGSGEIVPNKQFDKYHYLWKDNEKEVIEKTKASGK